MVHFSFSISHQGGSHVYLTGVPDIDDLPPLLPEINHGGCQMGWKKTAE